MTMPEQTGIRIGILQLMLGLVYLAVASCAQAATISKDDQYPFYNPSLVNYVASKGTFPVVVVANPFGTAKDDAFLANLSLPGYYPPTPFTATTARTRDDGHLVLIFAPITAANGHDACRSPISQTNAGPGKHGQANNGQTLRLQAAFCYDRDVVSEAFMEMPEPRNMDDQAFAMAMDQLLDVLLPNQSPHIGACGVNGTQC
ncbi:MAG: hypothetical protein HN834_22550 [Rhodospirillaceae bacterium]|nr:hypothetical protein [Rhodospirillaceae bacterium]MBT7663824.1 hypothetical protein [Rhodospirillaceae bacterium]